MEHNCSIDDPFDDDIADEWSDVIARRIAELDSGEVQAIPWEEAKRQILAETSIDRDEPNGLS
jgi:hypothetical protein